MGSELRRCHSDPGLSRFNRRPNKMTLNDALNYLKDVKCAFAENSDSYKNFLQVLRDFKNHAISTEEVARRVNELFRWHPYLLWRFNQFLPKGYQITSSDEAMNYVTKIKDQFTDEKHIYTTFLSILNSYRKSEINIQDVIHEMQELFRDHPDLLEEFFQFVPTV